MVFVSASGSHTGVAGFRSSVRLGYSLPNVSSLTTMHQQYEYTASGLSFIICRSLYNTGLLHAHACSYNLRHSTRWRRASQDVNCTPGDQLAPCRCEGFCSSWHALPIVQWVMQWLPISYRLHGLKVRLLGLQNAVRCPVVEEQDPRLRPHRLSNRALLEAKSLQYLCPQDAVFSLGFKW